MSMIAIVTKYHGPTNTKGARISARRGDHKAGDKVVWVPFEAGHDETIEGRYRRAANALGYVYGWDVGRLVAGAVSNGYVFCFAERGY